MGGVTVSAYPPVGTRVRWTSQGGGKARAKEGVVVTLTWENALTSRCSFVPWSAWLDAGAMRPNQRPLITLTVVEVDTVDGQPRRSGPRYYHPRPQWLEVVETAGEEAKL